MSFSHAIVRRFIVTSALALAIPITGFAQEVPDAGRPANGDRHVGMRGGEHRMHSPAGLLDPRSLRHLDLSQTQREQIRKIFEEDRDARRQQHDAMMTARKALHDLVISGQYDAAKAKELATSIANQESAHILAMAEQANRVMQILSPEQRAKLKDTPNKD